MSNIDRRLAELGITLPIPWTLLPAHGTCESRESKGQAV